MLKWSQLWNEEHQELLRNVAPNLRIFWENIQVKNVINILCWLLYLSYSYTSYNQRWPLYIIKIEDKSFFQLPIRKIHTSMLRYTWYITDQKAVSISCLCFSFFSVVTLFILLVFKIVTNRRLSWVQTFTLQ